MQFAVDVLKVRHILVVGHYGCGGVLTALQGHRLGLIDNWLRHVQDVRQKHAYLVEAAGGLESRGNRLCELNVIEQVMNVCETTIVQDAWLAGQNLTVHGLIYALQDGLIRDLHVSIRALDQITPTYQGALRRLAESDQPPAVAAP